MSTGTPGWPPSFEDACTEKLEALWLLALDATERHYDEAPS